MASSTLSEHDRWSVDEPSLAALTRALSTQTSDKAWFSLRREAEQLALVPGFDRLITLDANTIKELPHQIDVATRVLRRPMAGRAISAKHRREILRHRWDLVIVDEAHKVKNQAAARYKFLQEVERNYILLLTATPLQNNLRELYNLVTLLRYDVTPGAPLPCLP